MFLETLFLVLLRLFPSQCYWAVRYLKYQDCCFEWTASVGNNTSPCEPKRRAAESRSASCFLPLLTAILRQLFLYLRTSVLVSAGPVQREMWVEAVL